MKTLLVVSETPVDPWGKCVPTVEEVEVVSEEEDRVSVLLRDGTVAEVAPESLLLEGDPYSPVKEILPGDPRVGLSYAVVSFLEGGVDPGILSHVDPEEIREALNRVREHPWIALPGTAEYLEEYLQSLK